MVLKEQICYEKGFSPKELTVIQEKGVMTELAAVQKRIESAVSILMTTQQYKDGRLKVRYYSEFIPWWLYVFDNEMVFLGILKKGERSTNAPVLLMKKNKDYTSIFDAFYNNWVRLWENGTDV